MSETNVKTIVGAGLVSARRIFFYSEAIVHIGQKLTTEM